MKLSDKQINAILFTTLSILWGFTWLAGKWQIHNTLMPEFAAMYRFLISSLSVLAFCLLQKYPMKITASELKIFTFYGFFSSCLNFIMFYYAALYFITGFSAVIYALSILFSIFIGRWFFGIQYELNWRTVSSIALGIGGLVLVILPKIQHYPITASFFSGVFLALIATTSFSIGSVFFESKSKAGQISLNIPVSFFYFNFIGSIFCGLMGLVHCLMDNKPVYLIPNFDIPFILSFLYLSVISTSIGYMCFFALIKRIGTTKATYTTLISPVLAMLASSVFEEYKWTYLTFLGLAMIVGSKLVLNTKPKSVQAN
jgi:drug/metabolite transporter (DMT)-like permease